MPARQIVMDRYLSGKLPVLRDLPLDNPIAVDANWGYYFATGSSEPIQRLVRALASSRDKNNVEKLTLGSTIKWALAVNASHDPELLGYLKTSLPHQPDDVEVPLQDIIESCETFELAHIRKQATDSIEELRRKGSEASRNFAWWGQAGQTALSLGCVAAAVGGQATAEIPCVVGSAMSTAGLKYLCAFTLNYCQPVLWSEDVRRMSLRLAQRTYAEGESQRLRSAKEPTCRLRVAMGMWSVPVNQTKPELLRQSDALQLAGCAPGYFS